jgi:hypothetical protein
MYINGHKCRKSKTIAFRMSIEGDKNQHGEQVDNNYVSFVKIKDCPIVDGYYNPYSISVKCIPINHGGTFYGYGEPKIKLNQPKRQIISREKVGIGTVTKGIMSNNWIEIPFYAVFDAQVYVGNIKNEIPKEQLLKLQREKKLKRILNETV